MALPLLVDMHGRYWLKLSRGLGTGTSICLRCVSVRSNPTSSILSSSRRLSKASIKSRCSTLGSYKTSTLKCLENQTYSLLGASCEYDHSKYWWKHCHPIFLPKGEFWAPTDVVDPNGEEFWPNAGADPILNAGVLSLILSPHRNHHIENQT